MGGIILQMLREPEIKTVYLHQDNGGPDPARQGWTEKRTGALFFTVYGVAETRAEEMGGRPIFAVVTHGAARALEPMPPWGVPVAVPPLSGPMQLVQEAIHRRRDSRRVRRDDWEAEVRERDLRELERIETE